MTLMTHALTQPTTARYTQLSPKRRADFHRVMDVADTQASNAHEYLAYMAVLSVYAGIQLPTSGDIALCDCFDNGCGCDLIFDSNLPGAVVTALNDPDCNLSRLQCPDCGHDHPRPTAD